MHVFDQHPFCLVSASTLLVLKYIVDYLCIHDSSHHHLSGHISPKFSWLHASDVHNTEILIFHVWIYTPVFLTILETP